MNKNCDFSAQGRARCPHRAATWHAHWLRRGALGTARPTRLVLLFVALTIIPFVSAQTRPYIGFVYPAGGQQGSTFKIKLGGQGLDDIANIFVTGSGVSVRIVEYNKVIGPQEIQLLNEQLRELKRNQRTAPKSSSGDKENMMVADNALMMASAERSKGAGLASSLAPTQLIARIEKRTAEYVNRPACAAIASIVYAEVTAAADAPPGERELRVTTARGISNPLVFHVGQLPEHTRQPMLTASFQVLGKEELSLRKRPTNEIEVAISTPCTVNGQVASGELNKYRFAARKGQRLVITAVARQLIPFVADAVPGWFQPVLALHDASGKEVAYADDYRFKPDPTILCEIPKDGEYVFTIHDAIFRGREDFIYRATIGEVPFLTSIFPLGAQIGAAPSIKAKGWNNGAGKVTAPTAMERGVSSARTQNDKLVSNPLPFAIDSLSDIAEKEPNHKLASAQKIQLPTIINGRIDFADDWDVYQFQAKAGALVAAEVMARRLDSPLDSVLKITDASGKLLAINDDREDLGSGINTHHADSYLMFKAPQDGTYFVHIGDTARSGGEEYGYRLRISAPQPDFALRIVPSSIAIRSSNSASVTVYAMRKDGFTNTIRVALNNPPPGFTSPLATLSGTQTVTRLTIRADLPASKEPVSLSIIGTGRVSDRVITNVAVAAEDRMQAFLWRHLVPAMKFKALVFDPVDAPRPKRIARQRPSAASTNSLTTIGNKKFTKQQVAGRLRQLKGLFDEGLLTDDFYDDKVAECEAAQ
jgi:hypothetical protein